MPRRYAGNRRCRLHPIGTRPYRAAIVARTRFVEDLLAEASIAQYILLGAGLDTFVQRHPELATRVVVFEIDQPGPQAWKRQRLEALGYGVPDSLRLIATDFETDKDWRQLLLDAGLDPKAKAIVSSSGVLMYATSRPPNSPTRYLTGRTDGLSAAGGEGILVART